jgi:hypothetical protein
MLSTAFVLLYALTATRQQDGCAVPNRPQTILSSDKQALVDQGHLTDVAAEEGHVVTRLGRGESVPTTFEGLARRSDEVIVGAVVACRPIDAKSRIDTIYTIATESVLRGASPEHSEVQVEFPGGYLRLPNGADVETSVPNFQPPLTGQRLVVFLGRQPEISTVRVLTAGVWSSFVLTGDKVEPSFRGLQGDNVATKSRRYAPDAFVEMIRAVVRAKKN